LFDTKSKPARLRLSTSFMPELISKRRPAFTVSFEPTRQSSCTNRPWDIWLHWPGEAISTWLETVPGAATAPVAAVGRPSRNCANDCPRSFSAAQLFARVSGDVDE